MLDFTTPELALADVNDVRDRALEALRPPPKMTVSEWADEERVLSAESSASPGKWRTSTVEYLREPMDMVGQPGVRRITLMTSAQVGKSSFVENVIGYVMDNDPSPILHVSPTLTSMKMFSKERLAPMLRDTPSLRGLVKDARARDSDNTIDTKKFPGGNIAMVGANAPAGLASRPVRVVLCDEVDRFEASAGTEGDPIKLAIKRTTTYWNRILIFVSTPGDADKSRIHKEYLAGDQRQLHVPCPCCGEHQVLKWAQVKWENDDPTTAYYECEHNGCVIDDRDRKAAVKLGHWVPQKEFNGNVSYHLSQLSSPFAPLADGVEEFLDAKHNPEELKTWVNTFLGEVWEERGERLEWSHVKDRVDEYDPSQEIPEDVTLITAAADVQDDRIEIEYIGWGDDERSWGLGYHKIYGDLSTREPWDQLRDLLARTFIHPLFGEMIIRGTCIDSGGHYTQEVYRFVQRTPRTTAIKGVGGDGRASVGKPTKNTIGGHRVFPLGVNTLKETVVKRMSAAEGHKGSCVWPKPYLDGNDPVAIAGYDDDYFRGLTAEKRVTRKVKGFDKKEWIKIRARNEPFDLRVYGTAALEMLNLELNAHRRVLLRDSHRGAMSVKTHKPNKIPGARAPTKQRRQPNDWVKGWKK